MATIIGHITRVGRRPRALQDDLSTETRSVLEAVLEGVMDLHAMAVGARRRMRRGLRREATFAELRELHRGIERMPVCSATLINDLLALLGLQVDDRQRVLPLGQFGPTPKAA